MQCVLAERCSDGLCVLPLSSIAKYANIEIIYPRQMNAKYEEEMSPRHEYNGKRHTEQNLMELRAHTAMA